MSKMGFRTRLALLAATLCTSPAWADKPEWAGKGRGGPHGHEARHAGGTPAAAAPQQGAYFGDHHNQAVREFYGRTPKAGKCPPGLAKKQNGCLPPGQAKKWAVGQPLPRDVVWYEVPRSLNRSLGLPPPGYKYVRVAGDILLIAVGTQMVVDAIKDLGGL
ncbi:MAG TPA: hypothetical protein PKD29_06235 [Rhodocyclaceae bacterium]|nr:hypothetical protein [Rhodocyclaceae bacterium]